ncbi:membrane protein [Streptomyces gulbargensis]|uniref:Membrane protein n=1 Tax=Streptomyces gulbargensis TaxID=364901 RepID=A0ABP7LK62_9ACTN
MSLPNATLASVTHTARRIGRSLALVLPVVLVLSGTLAVSAVPWAGQDPTTQMLTASSSEVSSPAKSRAPQDVLREQLLAELQEKDPGVALTHLQRAVENRPSLAKHCMSIARALGRAAVDYYGPTRAQSFSRPVCDTSYASGVMRAG